MFTYPSLKWKTFMHNSISFRIVVEAYKYINMTLHNFLSGIKYDCFVVIDVQLDNIRVVWFKSFDLNHWFKSWFKLLQKNQKKSCVIDFLIFINILSIIINILLIFNDKFDFFF